MEESKKKKQELSPYYVVEFVSRGRKPAVKKVDVVVSSWLFINNKTKTPATKFPEEPYDNLSLYLENRLPAPASWLSYTVKVRARAATLDEAFKKLGQIMKDGESALTLSSGESATEVEKKEIDKIRQMQFIQEANQYKKTITDVPKAVRTSLKASTDNSTEQLNQRQSLRNTPFNQHLEALNSSSYSVNNNLLDNNSYGPSLGISSQDEQDQEALEAHEEEETNQDQVLDENFDNIHAQLSFKSFQKSPIKTYKNVSTKNDGKSENRKDAYEEKSTIDYNQGTPQTNSSVKPTDSNGNVNRSTVEALKAIRDKQKKRKALTNLTNTSKSPIRKKPKFDTQTNYDFQEVVIDYLMYLADSQDEIYAQIKSNTEEIATIKTLLLKQTMNEDVILNRNQLSAKYSYELPFLTVQSFQEFDKELENRKSGLCSDVKNMLLSGLDSNFAISKCMVNMLKMVISREVAMQYTAVKEVKDKNVMSNTNLYSCISGIIKERRMASNLPVTDKEFKTALSNVLTNASGWKSSSENEKKSRKPRKPKYSKKTKPLSKNDDSSDDLTGDESETQSLNSSNPKITLSPPTSGLSHTLMDPRTHMNNDDLLELLHTLPIISDDDVADGFNFDNLLE